MIGCQLSVDFTTISILVVSLSLSRPLSISISLSLSRARYDAPKKRLVRCCYLSPLMIIAYVKFRLALAKVDLLPFGLRELDLFCCLVSCFCYVYAKSFCRRVSYFVFIIV